MIKDKRNIDALFKEGLKKFKEKPPPYAWDKLDKDLSRVKFRKSMVYVRWLAASIIIALAFGAGYYYAIYNYSNPDISENDYISPTTTTADIVSSDRLSVPSNINKSQDNNEREPTDTGSGQDKKTDLSPMVDEVMLTQNNFSDNNVIENLDDHKLNNFLSYQNIVLSHISFIQINNIQSIPVNQSYLEVIGIDQIKPAYSETTVKNQSNLPIYYYPEDYGLEAGKSKEETKWAVGAQFAPVISYRDISINYQNQQGSIINEDETRLNDAEDALLSYAGGVDLNYSVSKRWSLQSGLYFSRIGQVNNDALNFKQDNNQYLLYAINTSTGNINIAFEKVPEDVKKFDSPKDTLNTVDFQNVRIIQNFDLFEIPVVVKYKILDKRFGINLSGGLSPAYLIKNNTYLEVDNTKHDIGSSENLNPLIVNTSLALGFNYGISKKLSINFEPTFKYSLSPINKNSQFDYHPYYFSWYTGIRYSF